jgi:hypothetical protein
VLQPRVRAQPGSNGSDGGRSSTVKSGSMAALFFRVSKGKERRRCWGIYRDFISCETSKDRARTGDFGG